MFSGDPDMYGARGGLLVLEDGVVHFFEIGVEDHEFGIHQK